MDYDEQVTKLLQQLDNPDLSNEGIERINRKLEILRAQQHLDESRVT